MIQNKLTVLKINNTVFPHNFRFYSHPSSTFSSSPPKKTLNVEITVIISIILLNQYMLHPPAPSHYRPILNSVYLFNISAGLSKTYTPNGRSSTPCIRLIFIALYNDLIYYFVMRAFLKNSSMYGSS